jgi:hypothetical protein
MRSSSIVVRAACSGSRRADVGRIRNLLTGAPLPLIEEEVVDEELVPGEVGIVQREGADVVDAVGSMERAAAAAAAAVSIGGLALLRLAKTEGFSGC